MLKTIIYYGFVWRYWKKAKGRAAAVPRREAVSEEEGGALSARGEEASPAAESGDLLGPFKRVALA